MFVASSAMIVDDSSRQGRLGTGSGDGSSGNASRVTTLRWSSHPASRVSPMRRIRRGWRNRLAGPTPLCRMRSRTLVVERSSQLVLLFPSVKPHRGEHTAVVSGGVLALGRSWWWWYGGRSHAVSKRGDHEGHVFSFHASSGVAGGFR